MLSWASVSIQFSSFMSCFPRQVKLNVLSQECTGVEHFLIKQYCFFLHGHTCHINIFPNHLYFCSASYLQCVSRPIFSCLGQTRARVDTSTRMRHSLTHFIQKSCVCLFPADSTRMYKHTRTLLTCLPSVFHPSHLPILTTYSWLTLLVFFTSIKLLDLDPSRCLCLLCRSFDSSFWANLHLDHMETWTPLV